MSVKKSILETKTNKELEEYLKEGNRFIPEARLYAFEILKDRGIEFSEAETQRIMLLIPQKTKFEEIAVHTNYKKAANLIYVSAGLGLINVILSPQATTAFGIIVAIFTLGILIGIGYLVSKGNEWIKYVLLVLMLVGLLAIPVMLLNIVNNPIVGIINIIQTVLQIYSLVLLFKISKTN
ncbi:hypothetical protein SAMN05421741_11635 [Paenimyroides ummariense]|uniref:Uncharacterized protein n=1 Tax=Paenimyroides ummariense TaxID=913024 RepID=A0A1I5DKI8_9FLAO|nr:hypothetical protein [Paenimyroides ummariense]SFN99732.1 hypothetical protein SAMN05421741_11635 [Paenimyroides ummariense]